MKVHTIRFIVQDDSEALYYKAVWHLVDALLMVGARHRVVPALQELFDEAFAKWDGKLPER
ncbi:MAG: hypothetical protein AUI14_16160 [Actinobacteria bacterium 13_2_20CM_2_71_6]|nr:MAG: hypothetical protein AUI14_16160 [Actinobacteria bacterium 13_2_20CM_2_71_6]